MTAGEMDATLMEARLRPIGVIRSVLTSRSEAPRQGAEGAPDAWLQVHAWAAEALWGLAVGDEVIVITWFHQAVATSSRSTRGPTRATR